MIDCYAFYAYRPDSKKNHINIKFHKNRNEFINY